MVEWTRNGTDSWPAEGPREVLATDGLTVFCAPEKVAVDDTGHIPATGPRLQPGPNDDALRKAAFSMGLRLLSMALHPHEPRDISFAGTGMVDALVSVGGVEHSREAAPDHRFAELEVDGVSMLASEVRRPTESTGTLPGQ